MLKLLLYSIEKFCYVPATRCISLIKSIQNYIYFNQIGLDPSFYATEQILH